MKMCNLTTRAMNKINTNIKNILFLGVGGGAQFNSLPQAQKTLVTALTPTDLTCRPRTISRSSQQNQNNFLLCIL
jgi:hypothetical protein